MLIRITGSGGTRENLPEINLTQTDGLKGSPMAALNDKM
jgi:hypothetical protein